MYMYIIWNIVKTKNILGNAKSYNHVRTGKGQNWKIKEMGLCL